MRKILILIILIGESVILYGQTLSPSQGSKQTAINGYSSKASYPREFIHDLGLHGIVTWLSDTKVRVEYDWSNDTQLSDWTTTNGSRLIRGNNIVTVIGGMADVRSMIWKQLINCTRIYAQNAKAINSPAAHLNFITNVIGWTGYDYNPPEMIGLLYNSSHNLWLESGGNASLDAPEIVLGNEYTVDINVSATQITALSSSDNNSYSNTLVSPPDNDRQVAIGGWGGDTQWGKITIEGEISSPVTLPPDMINIQSTGASFAPVIQVSGSPVIEWVFDDATTSSSATPVKNYGTIGSRHNYLKVTPWSALIGINVGYDAADGGYGGFAMVPSQFVSGIQNLSLAKSSLQYFCANYNPITELDLSELTALRFVELLYCQNLTTLVLGSHPVLERICVEDCNLGSIDLSGCTALADLRSAQNNYTSINWGTTGAALWHICVRSNPGLTANLPDLTQFPLLRELLTWEDNQTGQFICHSSIIQKIDSYDNHYTGIDISGTTSLMELNLSGNQLTYVDLGTALSLRDLTLKGCGLTESQVDYILQTLDASGVSFGVLDLNDNAAPSEAGLTHNSNLILKNWTTILNTATGVTDPEWKNEPIKVIVTSSEVRMLLSEDFVSWKAELFNYNGDLLFSRIIDSETLVFDVSSFSSGIFIVALSKGEKRRITKVIKP